MFLLACHTGSSTRVAVDHSRLDRRDPQSDRQRQRRRRRRRRRRRSFDERCRRHDDTNSSYFHNAGVMCFWTLVLSTVLVLWTLLLTRSPLHVVSPTNLTSLARSFAVQLLRSTISTLRPSESTSSARSYRSDTGFTSSNVEVIVGQGP